MSGSRGARDGKAVTTMELAWGASSAHPPVLALLSAVAAQPVVDGINGSGTGPFYSVQARHVENALFTSRSLSCPTCPRTTLPRFVLGEVFVGTRASLFAGAPPRANEVFVG